MRFIVLALIIVVLWVALLVGITHETPVEPKPVATRAERSFDHPPLVVAPTTTAVPTTTTAVARTAPSKRGVVWARLATCESGQRWTITDRYHEGGYQFAHSTWDNYRRPDEPADANLATPAKQLEVAKRVLRAEGVRAWPTCGPRVGLTMADAA